MIKIAAIAFLPVFVATFYAVPTEEVQSSQVSRSADSPREVALDDRAFLALVNRAEPSFEGAESADRAFLANLQGEDRLTARSRSRDLPVLRAIPVERPRSVQLAKVEPAVSAPATEASSPEIRRAIAVPSATVAPTGRLSSGDLRNALRQPFVTMIQSDTQQPRANVTESRRASITIYGDQVVVRTKAALR